MMSKFKCVGNFDFAKKLLQRKPTLASEVDLHKSTPLHLASDTNNVELVTLLLNVSPGIVCRARNAYGRCPVHVAAIKGRIDVAALVRTYQDDSILHLCVKYNQFEALKVLIERISDNALLNCGDCGGNTILHLSVLNQQSEILVVLLRKNRLKSLRNSADSQVVLRQFAGGCPKDFVAQETGGEVQAISLLRKPSIAGVFAEGCGGEYSFKGCSWKIGNGSSVLAGKDRWMAGKVPEFLLESLWNRQRTGRVTTSLAVIQSKRVDILPKWKLFTWKLLRNGIATRCKLDRIGLEINIQCDLCGFQEEDLQHLFRVCTSAQDAWRGGILQFHSQSNADQSFEDWILWFIRLFICQDGYHGHRTTFFIATLWG
uniref:Reverse transcriptase zinc-binding domain-containing protein n=1 Tax=Chenopodium quinoa TaxID=63459 RepID=A0A803MLK6_CHEQI